MSERFCENCGVRLSPLSSLWAHGICHGCNEAYEQPEPDPSQCPDCDGNGYIITHGMIDGEVYDNRFRCETCNPNVGEPADEVRIP